MRKQKFLLTALALVVAASVAYAAAAGVLTINGSGTLGEAVQLEFFNAAGTGKDVAAPDITLGAATQLSPADIVINTELITVSNIRFANFEGADGAAAGNTGAATTAEIAFTVRNVGTTDAIIAGTPSDDVNVTRRIDFDTDIPGGLWIEKVNDGPITSNNAEFASRLNASTWVFEQALAITAAGIDNDDEILAGQTLSWDLNVAFANLGGSPGTAGAATDFPELAPPFDDVTLSGASFSFTKTLNYEAS